VSDLFSRGSRMKKDIHLGEPGFLSKVLRRRELESVFLFLTGRCNSKCRHCFYVPHGHDARPGADLTFAEMERISRSAGHFDKLWLSGGEPFLREDLAEILEMFHQQNRVQAINLPTNALLPDRVERVMARLLETCPDMTIHLNFSLDGLGEKHDRFRGVPGSFAKTIDCLERVERRFGDNPKLLRNVASVVTVDTIDDAEDLAAYLFRRFRLATHFFEAVRGETRDPALQRVSREQLADLHRRLLPCYQAMARRLFGKLPRGPRDLAELFFVGTIGLLYDLQEQNMNGPHPWGMECTAGQTTMVIDHDGAFRSCEMRPPIGNLRDYDFDLRAAYRGRAMRDEVTAIGGGQRANCWCTHTCWMLASMKFSPRSILLEVPRHYLGYRWQRMPPFSPERLSLDELARRHPGCQA
jgi:Fe-coproporphyrin III synthase